MIAVFCCFYGMGRTQTDSLQIMADLIGLDFNQAELDSLRTRVYHRRSDYEQLRRFELDNQTPPSLYFNPLPDGFSVPTGLDSEIEWQYPTANLPESESDLAFYSILELAALIKSKTISSTDLTTIFLDRLKKYGDTLKCVVTLTEERAYEQARQADSLLSEGTYLGPLHGIPYGAKDLFSVPGYKTTWGAMPYKDQVRSESSDLIERLDRAGAVLVAKLSLGALAMGDVWFGGTTKNPWNLDQGSSGSSAGSASATVAGLVPFSIGTETWGSIISPSTRCGATGLRPTFGRVSRAGAMALSWSMDKIGPICRSAEDCAIVFDAIRGKGKDYTSVDAPFPYDQTSSLSGMRVGFFKNLFDSTTYSRESDSLALMVLEEMGVKPEPLDYDLKQPVGAMSFILTAEAAAAFDDLTRSNEDELLVRQTHAAWPNIFRAARYVTAVEYIQANRMRTLLLNDLHKLIKDYDVIITPTFEGTQMLATNLTGHPAISIPHGFAEDGTPRSITFLGNLYEEHKILALAHAFQEHTEYENKHPEMFKK